MGKAELRSPLEQLSKAIAAAEEFVRMAKKTSYRAENIDASHAEVPTLKEIVLGTKTTCETHLTGAKTMKTRYRALLL